MATGSITSHQFTLTHGYFNLDLPPDAESLTVVGVPLRGRVIQQGSPVLLAADTGLAAAPVSRSFFANKQGEDLPTGIDPTTWTFLGTLTRRASVEAASETFTVFEVLVVP